MPLLSKQIKKKLAKTISKLEKRKIIPLDEFKENQKRLEHFNNFILNKDISDTDLSYELYLETFYAVIMVINEFSGMEEFKDYHSLMEEVEDLYHPDYPPLSPITHSFNNWWSICDASFGKDNETIPEILLDIAELLDIPNDVANMIKTFSESSMSIYQVTEIVQDDLRLQDIFTNKEYFCFINSGYHAKQGELFFVRIMPPIQGYGDRYIIQGTPYILEGATRADWHQFFIRKGFPPNSVQFEKNYRYIMKNGFTSSKLYWHEYIFLSYLNHTPNAITLSGIPDLLDTLPYGRLANKNIF